MAKAIPTEQLAIHTLAGLISDPAPKVMHGSKSVSGIFKAASRAEKTAANMCLEKRWLEPTGEFVGTGRSKKELYRITLAGIHVVLSNSDPSELLRNLQEGFQKLGIRMQSLPQEVEKIFTAALAPFALLPVTLESLQKNIGETLTKIKLPNLDELSRKLNQPSANSQEHASSRTSVAPASAEGDWLNDVVRMAVEQQRRNAFQRLTLPEIYNRLRARHPQLTLGQFHDGLRRLQDEHRIRLGPYTQALATLDDPRNALFLDREVKYYVEPY